MKVQKSVVAACALFLLTLCLCLPASAQNSHETLYPLLADLPGWTSDEPAGTSMNMGDMTIVTAQRGYNKDGNACQAALMIGNTAMVSSQSQMSVQYESAQESASTSTVDGFKVMRAYNKIDNAGSVVVFLGESQSNQSMLIFTFENIKPDAGLELARKFDWKKMAAAIKPLL